MDVTFGLKPATRWDCQPSQFGFELFNPTGFYGKRSSPTQTGSQGTPGFFPSKPWHLPVFFFWSGKSEKMDRSDRCLPNFSDKVNKWNIWQNIREISGKYLAKTAKTPSMPEVCGNWQRRRFRKRKPHCDVLAPARRAVFLDMGHTRYSLKMQEKMENMRWWPSRFEV